MGDTNKNATLTLKTVTAPLEAGIRTAVNAVGTLTQAFGKLEQALKLGDFAAQFDRAAKSLPTAQLEAFSRATGDTVDKLSLLSFAQRAMHGDLALTAKGMTDVLGAATRLHQQGFGPTVEIAQKLDEALRSGRTRGLREFGIALDETKDKHVALNEMLDRFHKLASDTTPTDQGAQKFERFQARLQNSLNELKHSLGEFVIATSGYLNAMLTTARTWVSNINDLLHLGQTGSLSGVQVGGGKVRLNAAGQAVANAEDSLPAWQKAILDTPGLNQVVDVGGISLGSIPAQVPDLIKIQQQKDLSLLLQTIYSQPGQTAATNFAIAQANATYGAGAADITNLNGLGGGGGKGESYYRAFDPNVIDRARGGAAPGAVGGDLGGASIGLGGIGGLNTLSNAAPSGYAGAALGLSLGYRATGQDQGSRAFNDNLAKQQLAQLTSLTSAAGAAANAGVSALSAAVDAAVAGGKGIVAAAEAAAKASLRATAVKATVQAAWETAEGLASLAIGGAFGGASAAAHFKAAAGYAATAALAGTLSAAIPSGSSGGHAGGSAAGTAASAFVGPSRNASNGNSGGPTNVTVNMYGIPPGTDAALVGRSVSKALDAAQKAGRSYGGSTVVVVR